MLLVAAFVVLQGVVIFAAVGCFARQRRVACCVVLYGPPLVLTLAVALGAGNDWIAVLLVQAALSVMYNIYIFASQSDR